MDSGAHQVLVYSMTLSTRGDVAMILPLPIAPGTGEDGIAFVDLSGYAGFFDDMEQCFLVPGPPLSKGGFALSLSASPLPRLKVHAVGSFEASFVPTLRDFSRLDPRFRIRDEVWRKLPLYEDYGFAVFKLKKGRKATIHPMAFRFPTRKPDALFFPTVHVHDGDVHAAARFDHRLFYQGASPDFVFQAAIHSARSVLTAAQGMRVRDAKGLLDADELISSISAAGEFENTDTWVSI
jgi:hypothetical protein